MVTGCSIENDSKQEHETWSDTSDLDVECKIRLSNSKILSDLETKLNHVPPYKRIPLTELLLKYKSLFPDTLTGTMSSNITLMLALPVKQHQYWVNPIKLKLLRQEVQYMLDKDIIEPSQSSWASPCALVPKPDGSIRYCTDYRKVKWIHFLSQEWKTV